MDIPPSPPTLDQCTELELGHLAIFNPTIHPRDHASWSQMWTLIPELGLVLTGVRGARNVAKLEEEKIDVIVNVSQENHILDPDVQVVHDRRSIVHMIRPIGDSLDARILPVCLEVLQLLSTPPLRNKKPLVHCQLGMSRSASIVMAMGMMKWKWSAQWMLVFLRSKRLVVGPNIGFMSELSRFEYDLGIVIPPCPSTPAESWLVTLLQNRVPHLQVVFLGEPIPDPLGRSLCLGGLAGWRREALFHLTIRCPAHIRWTVFLPEPRWAEGVGTGMTTTSSSLPIDHATWMTDTLRYADACLWWMNSTTSLDVMAAAWMKLGTLPDETPILVAGSSTPGIRVLLKSKVPLVSFSIEDAVQQVLVHLRFLYAAPRQGAARGIPSSLWSASPAWEKWHKDVCLEQEAVIQHAERVRTSDTTTTTLALTWAYPGLTVQQTLTFALGTTSLCLHSPEGEEFIVMGTPSGSTSGEWNQFELPSSGAGCYWPLMTHMMSAFSCILRRFLPTTLDVTASTKVSQWSQVTGSLRQPTKLVSYRATPEEWKSFQADVIQHQPAFLKARGVARDLQFPGWKGNSTHPMAVTVPMILKGKDLDDPSCPIDWATRGMLSSLRGVGTSFSSTRSSLRKTSFSVH